jgi:acyl-CoA thioesterase-1
LSSRPSATNIILPRSAGWRKYSFKRFAGRPMQPFRSLIASQIERAPLFPMLLACCLLSAPAWSQDGLIVALGDSNTAGWGVGNTNAFPSQLNSMLQRRGYRAKIVNAGVSGDTLGGMLGRLDASVPAGTRLVIVQGGYNDVFQRTPPDVIVQRLQGILAKLHARRVPAVLCGFFDPKWDAIGRKLSAQYGTTFVPGSTCYSPSHRGPDGLHMSAAGHTVVAQRLMPVVAGKLSGPRVVQAQRAGAPKPTAQR